MAEQKLGEFLRSQADETPAVSILQPADPFLESAGEDLRRRIFITEAEDGTALCLRPEFTIPLCLHHIKNRSGACRYSYEGGVFRQERNGRNEFVQAGLEEIGFDDHMDADARCLKSFIDALKIGGVSAPAIILGDQALFALVVAQLGMSQALQRRLMRHFGDPNHIRQMIETLSSDNPVVEPERPYELLAANGDRMGLISAIGDAMKSANLPERGGRQADHIADRLIEKWNERSSRFDKRHGEALNAFLSLEAPLAATSEQLSRFADRFELDLGEALQKFNARNARLADLDVDLSLVTFRASFGRKLEYYSGILFEAVGETAEQPLAGGGRYDLLCTLLGASKSLPAVGFSINCDRLPGVVS